MSTTIYERRKENVQQGNQKRRKNAGVRLWEVAAAYGINDGNFSRKLRQELPQEEKKKILAIIDRLAQEKQEAI